jgi:alpha-1,6-mannosyltransferase
MVRRDAPQAGGIDATPSAAGPWKSLHLTNAWHAESGGIRAYYTAMLAAANTLGRPMRLVVPGERDEVREVGPHGRIYTVRAPRAPFVDRRYRVMVPVPFSRISERLLGILQDERPAIVEVCDKYALPYLAGAIRRFPPPGLPRPTLVGLSCERADHSLEALGVLGRIGARAVRWYLGAVYLPQCDYHLANSAYTAGELLAAQRPTHPRDVQTVPMGLHVATFGPQHRSEAWRQAWRQRLSLPPDGPLLVYVGRLAQEKQLTRAIDLLGHVRRTGTAAGLVLVGSGPDEERLRRHAAAACGAAVGFAGHVRDAAALAACYASGDAFVHVNDREPFGIGPLEAMASGVPVVLPRAGGVLTYATPANAWLGEPTAAGLAQAALEALAYPDPARLRLAAETARQYDWSSVAPAIFAAYDALHVRARTADASRWRPRVGHVASEADLARS